MRITRRKVRLRKFSDYSKSVLNKLTDLEPLKPSKRVLGLVSPRIDSKSASFYTVCSKSIASYNTAVFFNVDIVRFTAEWAREWYLTRKGDGSWWHLINRSCRNTRSRTNRMTQHTQWTFDDRCGLVACTTDRLYAWISCQWINHIKLYRYCMAFGRFALIVLRCVSWHWLD